MKILRNLPTPNEVKKEFPISDRVKKAKQINDQILKDILAGDNDLFILIIGPCSADNEDALIDYTNRLAAIQDKVKEKIFIVPRVYTNKPRTTGKDTRGWRASQTQKKKKICLKGFTQFGEPM